MEGKLSFWLKELTPEMVRKAKEELGETEEVKERALRDLRDMIENEKDFHPLMDDTFLLRFLRARKFDASAAFDILRNYYTFKMRYSGVVTDFRPSQVGKIFDMNIMAPTPTRMADGSVTGVLRLGHFDPGSATKEELLAACLVCAELGMESEATQVCGGSLIVDLADFDWRLLRFFASPAFLYLTVRLMQDCLPVRIKGLHVVNEPVYISVIFNMLRNLLTKKLKSRLFFHRTDLESLHKFFPPKMLPKELGGMLGPLDSAELRDRVLSMEAHFDRAIGHGFRAKRPRTETDEVRSASPISNKPVDSSRPYSLF